MGTTVCPLSPFAPLWRCNPPLDDAGGSPSHSPSWPRLPSAWTKLLATCLEARSGPQGPPPLPQAAPAKDALAGLRPRTLRRALRSRGTGQSSRSASKSGNRERRSGTT